MSKPGRKPPPDDSARVPGHALAWLGVLRANCACGERITLTLQDIEGCTDTEVRDLLMDQHAAHLTWVKERSR